jgi:hypothetical protein
MKKFHTFFLFLFSISIFSQSESLIVCKTVDEFTDKVSLDSGSAIVYEDGGDMKSEGMYVSAFLRESTKKKDKGRIYVSTFYVQVLGIEGCVDEGATLDIIFENGEKTQLVNWNDFDCKGTNYFRLTGKEDLFKSTNIKAIKYTNKRNYDSMIVKENIGDLSTYLKNVLIELDKINEGLSTVGICKE